MKSSPKSKGFMNKQLSKLVESDDECEETKNYQSNRAVQNNFSLKLQSNVIDD